MAGSALLWRSGHVQFGNADRNSAANQGSLANNILQNEQNRVAQIQANAASNDPNVSVNEDNPLLEPKKRKMRPSYDVQNFLLKEKGLDFVYEHFKNIKFKGKGHEIRDLKKLIQNYQEWAFIMYPSMNFRDIIKKTATFSSKNQVKMYLQNLRDKRDGVNQGMDDDDDEDIDLNMNNDNNNNASTGAQNVNENDNNNNNINQNNNNNQSQNNNQNQNGLQRQPDNELDAVLQARGQRASAPASNANNNSNNGANDWGPDPMDMGFGPDPMDMVGMEFNDYDAEIADLMYGM